MLAEAKTRTRMPARPAPPRPVREAADLRPLLPPGAAQLPSFTPENTEFVLLSFEGPDPYCRAGGLGVRATELATALASRGFATHFYFVGDPAGMPAERVAGLPAHRPRPGPAGRGAADPVPPHRGAAAGQAAP